MGEDFERELKALLAAYGADDYCGVFDYLLAAYLTGTLEGLRKIDQDRQARRQGTN
jgi:hypothetical protein